MMPTNQILCIKTIPEPRNSKQSKFFKNLKNSNNLGIRSESSQIIKVNRMLVTCYPVKHDVLWLKMFIRICFNKWKMLTWLILRLSPYVYPFSLGFPTWLKYLHLKRSLKDLTHRLKTSIKWKNLDFDSNNHDKLSLTTLISKFLNIWNGHFILISKNFVVVQNCKWPWYPWF